MGQSYLAYLQRIGYTTTSTTKPPKTLGYHKQEIELKVPRSA